MPRPRFHTLASERQEAILHAALEEFSTHGLTRASLNRIITAAGISKGSMYYYFDDKEDLYGHLLSVHVEQMVADAGPFAVPTATDPDAYWSTIEDHCLRLVQALDVIDSWVIAEAPDPLDHAAAVHTIVGILRRAIRP